MKIQEEIANFPLDLLRGVFYKSSSVEGERKVPRCWGTE